MTQTPSIDLDAYFQRIGHDGDRAPTLETLLALQLRHAQSIPFENLNPLLRLPVLLDPASLQRKLVHERRGGYCYEQNLLFRDVLRELGFTVAGLAARVLWNAPEGEIRPKTHMLLLVDFMGAPYIVDVGFGNQSPTGPLRLETGVEQPAPHGLFRLVLAEGDYMLESNVRGQWLPLYRFDLRKQERVDYEVANWYVSSHPSSHFVHHLLAARPVPGGVRYTLRDNELGIHRLDDETDRRLLTTPAEIREALETFLQISPPNVPELDSVLARLCGPTG